MLKMTAQQGHSERRGEEVRTALRVPFALAMLRKRKSSYSASGLRDAFPQCWASERCENDAWETVRLGAPGLGGWEGRLFQHPGRPAL